MEKAVSKRVSKLKVQVTSKSNPTKKQKLMKQVQVVMEKSVKVLT